MQKLWYDLQARAMCAIFAFTRERLAGLSTGHSWALVGSRVFHQKFGCGVVLRANGHKLTVCFDAVPSPKTVVDAFCEAAFDAYDKKNPKAFGAWE